MRKRQIEKLAASLSMLVLVSGIVTGCAVLPASLGGPATPAWELPPPPPAEGAIVPEGALHRKELPNGMSIVILEDDRLPRNIRRGSSPRRMIPRR